MTRADRPSQSSDDLAAENERLRALLAQAGLDPERAPGPTAAGTAAARSPAGDIAGDWLVPTSFARLLLDSISEGFYAVDHEGRTTLCNAALLRMLGFEREDEVLGQCMHTLVHHSRVDGSPYPLQCCPIHRSATLGTADFVTGEIFFRRDGTSFPVDYRVEPILRDGVLEGAICTVADISGRLQAEARLKESEQRLELALEAAGIGIWDFAPQSGSLSWDDRMHALFGLTPGPEITLGTSLAAIHPQDRPLIDASMTRAFDASGPGRYDVEFRTIGIEDGRERWVAANGQTFLENGRVVRFLGVARDISEQKKAEAHLRLMVNELNHRVKNSLAMVQGVASQTFRASADMPTARAAFTERLVNLARAHDILTATRWEGSDLETVVGIVAINHGGPTGNRFDFEGPPIALSSKTVLAVSMALHELATNALKYGALSNETGRVSIRWETRVAPNGGRRFRCVWRESGGPHVVAPSRRGFGSKLIERGLAAELQGEVAIEFFETGVQCTIDAPLTESVVDRRPS